VIFRSAYSDELGRAKSLIEGYPVPAHASYLLGVKEVPVERILIAIPWWKDRERESGEEVIRYYLSGGGAMKPELLGDIQTQLEALAETHGITRIDTDSSFPEEHVVYQGLLEQGYRVARSERYFMVPGAEAKERVSRVYGKVEAQVPASWKVESIRGYSPEKVYELVGRYQLMSPELFKHYWNTANRERFEEEYSCVLLEEGKVIGLLLVSLRGSQELHVHVEASDSKGVGRSQLISAVLRNYACANCAEGFPSVFICKADTEKHQQAINSALRSGGREQLVHHFFVKELSIG